MNIAQFYETIILRDLFEYVVPGMILLSAVGLVAESFILRFGVNASLVDALSKGGIGALFIFFTLAFSIGHAITSLSSSLLSSQDKILAANTLNENVWLKAQTAHILSHYMSISKGKALSILDNPKTVATLREIGRDIVLIKSPELYREHLGRMSIISKFCQNMAVAISCLLLSIGLSVVVLWNELQIVAQPAPLLFWVLGGLILVILIVQIKLFINRAYETRQRLFRYTFQLWYINYHLDFENYRNKLELSNASQQQASKDYS